MSQAKTTEQERPTAYALSDGNRLLRNKAPYTRRSDGKSVDIMSALSPNPPLRRQLWRVEMVYDCLQTILHPSNLQFEPSGRIKYLYV